MTTKFMIAWAALLALPAIGLPQPQRPIVGSVTSTGAISIDGVQMKPTTAPSWPIVEQDELATSSAAALLTTTEKNRLIFDPNTKVRLKSVEDGQTFVFIRKGGVAFDANARKVYICIGARLFLPKAPAAGTLRIEKNGVITHPLESGSWEIEGTRECDIKGPGALLSLSAGASAAAAGSAGATVTAAASAIPASVIGATTVVTGSAAAVGASIVSGSSASTCATADGCNFNPFTISPVQPAAATPTR